MRSDQVVSVELQGGIGNQMFQYAAGHALARRTGAELRLNLSRFTHIDKLRSYELACFALPAPTAEEPLPGAYRGLPHALMAKASKRFGLSTRRLHGGWEVYVQPGFHFDPAFDTLTPPASLVGYFQSEAFFRPVADEIRKLFAIRVPTSPAFEKVRAQIAAADWPVSIHVRRGDYVSDPTTLAIHGICDQSYYGPATALAERLCDATPTYFVFSDDPEGARGVLGLLRNAVYLAGDVTRPWEDIALMAGCRGHIIANSSFSWWGAWLDPRSDKWVIAPRRWFALQHLRKVSTADILCPGWIGL